MLLVPVLRRLPWHYIQYLFSSNFLIQAADVIVFLMDANAMPGPFGDKCLSCVVAQGIPSCFHVVQVFWHKAYYTPLIHRDKSCLPDRLQWSDRMQTNHQTKLIWRFGRYSYVIGDGPSDILGEGRGNFPARIF